MIISIFLKSKSGAYDATGTYDNRSVIVKEGSKIQLNFADHIRGGRKAKEYRNNCDIVNLAGVVLRDCTFSSPSTAAQFVTGRSMNGYNAWKVDKKTSLGKFLGR